MVLVALFMCMTFNTQAQFGKKLKEKLGVGESSSSSSAKEVEKEEAPKELNAWHKANEGKVVFYNKPISYYKNSSSTDSDTNVITERVIGSDGAFAFRAYLGKPYKQACSDCDAIDIKYTIEGVSLTTQQIREELDAYYFRMASLDAYYDSENYSVGVGMIAGPGEYFDMYTLQEDAYRILLSRVKDKLTKGASLSLKVEIIAMKEKVPTGEVLASGETTLKVSDESNNLQSLNCRCGKPGMTDANVIKEVKEAFEFQFNDVKEVYHVVLLDRDFTQNYDNSYPTKLVTSKGMWANIIYQKTDGIYMMVKRYIFFKKDGSGFSSKATIGKHSFFLPVSPTCAK